MVPLQVKLNVTLNPIWWAIIGSSSFVLALLAILGVYLFVRYRINLKKARPTGTVRRMDAQRDLISCLLTSPSFMPSSRAGAAYLWFCPASGSKASSFVLRLFPLRGDSSGRNQPAGAEGRVVLRPRSSEAVLKRHDRATQSV